MGVVIDFVRVKAALASVAAELDGADLNVLEAFADGRPSAERLAEYLAGQLASRLDGSQPYRLTVTEAPGCSASFYPQDGGT